jgi:O-antigen ligase
LYSFFGERVSPGVGIAIFLLMAAALFVLRLRTLLFLTILALLLTGLATPLYQTSRLLRWPFLVALLGKGILSGFARGLRPDPPTAAHRVLAMLSALAVVSSLWSLGPGISIAQTGMMIILWLGVFVVLWNTWRGTDDITAICATLFWVAVILFSAELIAQVQDPTAVFQAGRYSGLFTNPNGLGLAATFFAPFVFWRFTTADSPAVRRVSFVLGLFIILSLLLSGSRSGLLGTFVCMSCVLTHLYRFRTVLFAAFVVLPLLTFLFLGERIGRSEIEESRVVRSETLSDLSDRIPLWEKGIALAGERPAFGYGFGMSRFADLGFADGTVLEAVERLRGVNYHSSHLQVALDLGVAGLLLFWLYITLVIRRGLALFFSAPGDPHRFAGVVFFGVFLALVGDSFVHGWAFSPGSSMAILFWLTGAAVLRVHYLEFIEPARSQALAPAGAALTAVPLSAGSPSS